MNSYTIVKNLFFDCNPIVYVRGVFLEMSKAFDKVWHDDLIHTRSAKTASICFSVITVNDKHRKPEFNLKRVLV